MAKNTTNTTNINSGNTITGSKDIVFTANINNPVGEKNPLPNPLFKSEETSKNKDSDQSKAKEYPTVFISYSWEDNSHFDWILNLADKLGKSTYIILDRYELSAGKNMIKFMEKSIAEADKVLIIFTPNYKLKAEGRKGGVGYEYSIMNAELYNTITDNKKIIPILKSGTKAESIPLFVSQLITLDMTKQEDFEEKFTELLHAIYDRPMLKRPQPDTPPF